ncbi:hypothetical protein SCUP234_11867 [Seiridium cupressi]
MRLFQPSVLSTVLLWSIASAASQNASSSGCSQSAGSFSSEVSTRNVSGRSYLISMPSNYSTQTSSPVVLSFHGAGQSAEIQLESDQLTNSHVNDQYIVIYPEAVNEQWQVSPDSTTDDVGYVSDILDDVESSFCIDLARIYATGKSQGGGMVGLLACDQTLSTRIAAFAPVSGAFYVKGENGCDPYTVDMQCSPGRADIPIIEFHGGDDTVIPYYGDGDKRDACLPAIPHWVENWATLNNLSTSNTSTSITKSATLYQFGDGSTLGLVSHVYDGTSIGHVWPTTQVFAEDDGGTATASFNATPMILDFFSKYALNITGSTPASSGGNDTGTGSGSGNDTDSGSGPSGGHAYGRTVWWLLGVYLAQALL